MYRLMIMVLLTIFSTTAVSDDSAYIKTLKDGVNAYNHGNFFEAISLLEDSMSNQANSVTAYYLALSYYHRGNDIQASKYAKLALKKNTPVLSDKKKVVLQDMVIEINENALDSFVDLKSSKKKKYQFQFSEADPMIRDMEKAMYIKEMERRELRAAEEKLNKLGISPQDVNLKILLEKASKGFTPEDINREFSEILY